MTSRRILRSRNDRIIGGVASGLAVYFNTDPLFIRLAFVLLGFVQGFGVLLYLLLWLLLPSEETLTTNSRDQLRENVAEMQSTAERFIEQLRSMFNR